MAAIPNTCSVPACNNLANKAGGGAKGLCRKHYVRLQRHGDPEGGGTSKGATLDFIQQIAMPHKGEECLPWPFSRDPQGYGELRIDGEIVRATRLICELKHGPAPSPEHQAAHSCGKGHTGCASPHHLSWKTPSANQMDRVEHGTSNRGKRNHFGQLTEADVQEIRRQHGIVEQKELAAMFGVTKSNIQSIQYRRSWAWLP